MSAPSDPSALLAVMALDPVVAAAAASAPASPPGIEVSHLTFDYGASGKHKTILHDMSFTLPKGARGGVVVSCACGCAAARDRARMLRRMRAPRPHPRTHAR